MIFTRTVWVVPAWVLFLGNPYK